MTERIGQSLADVKNALRRLDRNVLLNLLREGVPAEEVRAALESARLPTSRELEAFYGWHNGLGDGGVIGEVTIFPGFYLLSLQEAIANYKIFVSDARWRTGWFPVFADGGGDFYVVDFGSSSEAAVRHFWIEKLECPVEFLSLGDLLSTIAAGYERNIIVVNSDGDLSMDYFAYAALANEMNPAVDWWRDHE